MNIKYIKRVYKDLTEVLISKESTLCKEDQEKLSNAKVEIEKALKQQKGAKISAEEKIHFFNLIVLIIEIIKNISDHFK